LLELITAQIQLTEVQVHFESAWHLPGAEHRRGEEVVLPPPPHTQGQYSTSYLSTLDPSRIQVWQYWSAPGTHSQWDWGTASTEML